MLPLQSHTPIQLKTASTPLHPLPHKTDTKNPIGATLLIIRLTNNLAELSIEYRAPSCMIQETTTIFFKMSIKMEEDEQIDKTYVPSRHGICHKLYTDKNVQ